jgi:amine acid ABC transporter, permease protein, 3-TM region, His/Glu/Gln/Arg/opine family
MILAVFSFDVLERILSKYGSVFIEGLFGTLRIAAITVFLGTLLGAVITVLRMIKFKPLQILMTGYVEILRGTPILLQLYIFYFGVRTIFNYNNDTFWILIALIVNSSAYVAEIFRSGIQAVDVGQSEAAKSLGMRNFNMFTRIIMPQAIKNILPALANEFITMIKETSLASVLFYEELMTSYKIVQSNTARAMEPLVVIAAIYFMLTFTLSKFVGLMEKRMAESD